MAIKFDIDKFIERSSLIHGNKYDYSISNYINIDTKIQIHCKENNIRLIRINYKEKIDDALNNLFIF